MHHTCFVFTESPANLLPTKSNNSCITGYRVICPYAASAVCVEGSVEFNLSYLTFAAAGVVAQCMTTVLPSWTSVTLAGEQDPFRQINCSFENNNKNRHSVLKCEVVIESAAFSHCEVCNLT